MSRQPTAGTIDVSAALDEEIAEAFGLLRRGYQRLLDIGDRGDLCALGPERLIDVAQRLEAHRSSLLAIDTGIIEAAREERLDEYTCSRSVAMALAEVLRISRATARARVARAEQLMPQHAFSLGTASAKLPVLAEAVRGGQVTCDQAGVIGSAMRLLGGNPQVGDEQARQAEQALVAQAASLGADDLRVVAAKLDEVLLPDGVLPREELTEARRGLTISAQRGDGTHTINGSLTPVAHARLMSVLSPLSAPRPAEDPMGADRRTAAQRLHDALEDAASRLLDTAGLPRSGGTPATVHVTIDADRLSAAVASDPTRWAPTRAVGRTGFGDRLTFAEIARLAEQACLIPTFLSATGGIVGYGRNRRCASEGQTNALIARDAGCSFPSCDAPPDWCERHHVVPWYRGGQTDLDNLTLVCGYHHREFGRRGWRVAISGGLPTWTPPTWLDREQRPMRNVRVHGADLSALDPAHQDAGSASGADPPPDQGEGLDAVSDLVDLLARHVDEEEREELQFEIYLVLDGYVGTSRPGDRRLDVVA